MKEIKIYTDGGSRGNPGPAACAFVIYENDQILFEKSLFIGTTTNNVAEYSGVLSAIDWCLMSNVECLISFYLDSELVVKQMKGEYRIKDERLKILYDKIKSSIINHQLSIKFNHVPRAQNARADYLVNQELDQHK